MIDQKLVIVLAMVLVSATVLPMTVKAIEEDDGYSYPPGATEEQKKQINKQEQKMWEDAGCPGANDSYDCPGDDNDD